MNDALLADLAKERLIWKENDALVYNLQMEVKQPHRYDLQRSKAQNDTLTNKLLILSTSQTEDKPAIIDLERRIKKEMDACSRVDAELREHQHAITNVFTQEELLV